MIFFTVYVWIKSIIKCSNNTYNCDKTYYENKILKKYIFNIQKYLNQSTFKNNNIDIDNYAGNNKIIDNNYFT